MGDNSILCTDVQHINAVHSKLKKWMNRFNGDATLNISVTICTGSM